MTVDNRAELGRRSRQFVPQGGPSVFYGQGALDHLGRLLGECRAERVLLVTGRSLNAEGTLLARVEERLDARQVVRFAECRQHTSDHSVLAGTDAFMSAGCDAIVSVGGGSVVDTAKGIALTAVVGEDLTPYHARVRRGSAGPELERGRLHARVESLTGRAGGRVLAPHLAVPTTLSGAEYTDHAGITTLATGIKAQVYHPDLVPVAVVLDPLAAATTPVQLWLSTGIKVLDHVVEILYSPASSAASEALCLASLRRVMRYLLPSADPVDEEARAEMQIAAWLAVAGYPNQMAGVGHAIGHQLGGLCAVPHGIGACCILPHAMEFNQAAAAGRFELMGEELGSEPIEAVRHLITATGLPSRLRDVGVPADRLEEIAAASFDDEAIVGNPRTVRSPQEILDEILVPAW